MADWDPFADPADNEALGAGAEVNWKDSIMASEAPPDPWNDNVYVDLAREAARLAAEQEAAEQKAKAERQQRAKEAALQEAAERERRAVQAREAAAAAKAGAPLEQAPTEAAPATAEAAAWEEEEDPERAQLLRERKAYVRGIALQATLQKLREAPSQMSASRQAAIRKYYEEEGDGENPEAPDISAGGEGNFREAAAQMMAESMGIRIKFKSSSSVSDVGLLFPDQGSRSLRLLSGVRGIPAVQAMLESAHSLLGFDLLGEQEVNSIYELFRGPEAIPLWLEEIALCQPAMYISGLAAIEKLKARRPGCLDNCKAVTGLSLGEYAALTYAGVFDFQTCLEIVKLRGEVMQEAAEASPQRMLSVAGLDRATLDRLCRESLEEAGEVCQVAHCLFPGGFTCAGSARAVERLLEKARTTEGCKQVQLMKIAGFGGFHTPLMAPARERLRQALREVEALMRPPHINVYMCASAQKIGPGTKPGEIIELLCDQLISPVRWEESVRAMIEDGIGQFYECGPMQQLKGMMKRIDEQAHGSMISVDHIQRNVKEKRGPSVAEPQDVTEGPLLPGGRNRVRIVW